MANVRARRWRAETTSPALFFVGLSAAAYVLCYAGAGFVGLPLYDRYTLPIVGFAVVLLAAVRRART